MTRAVMTHPWENHDDSCECHIGICMECGCTNEYARRQPDNDGCAVAGCREPRSHRQVFRRAEVELEVRVCERHAASPIPFPNGDLTSPIYSERVSA